jgi:hypothetical protein
VTAPTSQKLAGVLRAAGFDDLAKRAEADEWHEFFSLLHTFPLQHLEEVLFNEVNNLNNSEAKRLAAHHIRQRMIDGEFDVDDAESAAWAMSAEGKAAFKRLTSGK